MINEEVLIENNEEVKEPEIKNNVNKSKKTYFNFQIRQFDRELKNKLPNEFRNSLDGYNHRSISYTDYHIDENEYGLF